MGNIDTRNKLFTAISSNDPQKAKELLQKHPELLDEPISDDLKTTALTRAAYTNRPHIIAALSELGADLNATGETGISALMWAAARGHVDCVNILLDRGAYLAQTGPFEMNAIDFAVLNGWYNSAWILLQRGLAPSRTAEELAEVCPEMKTIWVDYPGMLMTLQCRIPPEVAPNFATPPYDKTQPLIDPVNDPRESWNNWFGRVLEFEDPPLIERASLPSNQQPQNTIMGKMKIFIGLDDVPVASFEVEGSLNSQSSEAAIDYSRIPMLQQDEKCVN